MFLDYKTCTISHTEDFNLKLIQKLWLWSPCSQTIHHFSITITNSTTTFPFCFFQLRTFTVPPVWKQLVAIWARAVVRAWDVHALVNAQLPSLVQPVHFTLVNICQIYQGVYHMFRKMVSISVSLFEHLQYQPAWNNSWKMPCLKCYSTTYILRAGKLWPKWMLISLCPLERITLFVTDWLHGLLSFLNKLITKEVKDSAIWDRWSRKAPRTFTSCPARISVMWAISLWELLVRQVSHWWSLPWQMLFSEVPLMWKPASQLQCWAWFTWAQRGLRLKAGSFMTLHSGGAAKGGGHTRSVGRRLGISGMRASVLTRLGLVLTAGATPALRAGAFILVQTLHAGTTVLTGIACTLTDVFRHRARTIMDEFWSLYSKLFNVIQIFFPPPITSKNNDTAECMQLYW